MTYGFLVFAHFLPILLYHFYAAGILPFAFVLPLY